MDRQDGQNERPHLRRQRIVLVGIVGSVFTLALGLLGITASFLSPIEASAGDSTGAGRRSLILRGADAGGRIDPAQPGIAPIQTTPTDKDTQPQKSKKKSRKVTQKRTGAHGQPDSSTRQVGVEPGKPAPIVSSPAGSNSLAPAASMPKNSSSNPSNTSESNSKDSFTPITSSRTSATSVSPSSAATSMPATSAAAAAAGAGNTPTEGSRSLQRLLREIPGLAQILSPAPQAPPPEPVAAPAPPLGPPPAGLPAAPQNWLAYHALNRLTFGGTPNQLNTVSHLTLNEARDWAMRFMKEQLELDPTKPWPTNLHDTALLPAPIPVEDSAAVQLLALDKADWRAEDGLPDVLSPSLSELQDQDLIRKFTSRRQLREKMAYFWDNHFNTNYRTHNKGQYELAENEAFRTNAFGRFLDLLTASAKSSAMMIYLNTDVSRKENPNENYARELQELHTLGVDVNGNPNGYTQADIVEAAKAFTGWTTLNEARPGFRFLSSRHSPGSKLFLGQSISFDGGGPGEGEQVLAVASRHPSTARHLATKLCVYFVSDTPSTSLVNEVASVFIDSGGDIKKVLIAIFASPDFNNVTNYRGLVKTPLEFMVGIRRNLGVWSSVDPFRNRLIRAGQGLFEKAPPTGYKEQADEWLNTDVLFNEVSFAYETTIPGFGSTIRFGSDTSGGLTRVWLKNLGLRTEEDILGFLLNLTIDRQVSATEYQVYLSTLKSAGGSFNLDNSNVETPLDRMLATILASPRYKYQ